MSTRTTTKATAMAKRINTVYTEHKPSGHLYQGVTHTTMSSAVKTLTQVKVRICVMRLLCTPAVQVTVSSVSVSTSVISTGRQPPPLSSVLYRIIYKRRSVVAAQVLLREKSGA